MRAWFIEDCCCNLQLLLPLLVSHMHPIQCLQFLIASLLISSIGWEVPISIVTLAALTASLDPEGFEQDRTALAEDAER